ncbi:DUF4406 domain-containing protein [Flavobacterium sp. TMP13]|uniref:DUF4406 domain-containing protein n=1 Tax=Flavobacterium sp. TMP13 TaxID=3425950 RepID=UPI003D77DC8E
MLKIYIAGKVTGLPENEVFSKFHNTEILLALADFKGVNPIKIVNNVKCEWSTAMRLCIAGLMQCDSVLLLPCFIGSNGALIESELAHHIKMPVFYNLKDLKEWRTTLATK